MTGRHTIQEDAIHCPYVDLGGGGGGGVALQLVVVQALSTVDSWREHVHDCLIGCHHDSRVGDLPNQLRCKTTIESLVTFLATHQEERLEKGLVLVALLP